MTSRPEIVFQSLSADLEPTVVVLAGEDVAIGGRAREIDQRAGGALLKAAEAAQYKGRKKSTVEVLAPPRLGSVSRVVLVGTGKTSDLKENDWVLLGGTAGAAISARKTKSASLIAEAADNGGTKPEAIAALLAFGAALRHYEFRKYLTKRPTGGRGHRGGRPAEACHPLPRPRQGTRRVRPLPGARQRHRYGARPRQRAG